MRSFHRMATKPILCAQRCAELCVRLSNTAGLSAVPELTGRGIGRSRRGSDVLSKGPVKGVLFRRGAPREKSLATETGFESNGHADEPAQTHGDEVDGLTPVWMISAVSFAIAMSTTPGPNNLMVASSGASFGFARTLPHIFGVVLGFTAMFVCVGLGASRFLLGHPEVLSILTWIGAAYLVWLAVQMMRAAPALPEQGAAATGGVGRRRRPMTFVEAALFQWVNPKGWVAVLSAVATYAVSNGEVAIPHVAWLALSFFVFSLVSTLLWTSLGVGVAKFLRTPRRIRLFNIAMAALLLASLVTLFV